MKYEKKVYILLLNWNGWGDTIECLESVFRIDYSNYQVIVCDNNSQDKSLSYIKRWAEGRLKPEIKPKNPLHHTHIRPISKPISYAELDRTQVIKWAFLENKKVELYLIQTGSNLGFAGGNNIGIRWVLSMNDFEFIWLINNDTVVEPNALKHLVKEAEHYENEGRKVGIIGSKLLYYDKPNIIQGVGGKYNRWFSATNPIGALERDNGQYDRNDFQFEYVIGSSMFVNKEFLHDVGLMSEEYFLYFEELDWALRGKQKNWELGYCWESRVYHKEGSAIGTSVLGSERSILADYYSFRNRIMITKKFFPQHINTVYLGFFLVFFNRIRRRQFDRVKMAVDILFSKDVKSSVPKNINEKNHPPLCADEVEPPTL